MYPYDGVLLSHKKEWSLTYAAIWMYLENIVLREIIQTQKDRYCIIPFTLYI